MSIGKKPQKSRFTRRSTAEQVTEAVDLSGKNIVITGANSGLGFESMRVLTERGAHVIAVARTLEKAQQACDKVNAETTPVACELSELESVVSCADTIEAMDIPIDVLLTNAGIMALPKLEQKMGLEMQFLTNHLGHFVLVNRLLERVKEAQAGRVVILSSLAHMQAPRGGIQFDNLSGEKRYSGWSFYGQSKLANLLTSNELARRLEGSNATSNAVHPGIIDTNLGRHMRGIASSFISLVTLPIKRSVPQGAATQCYVASHPNLDGVSGRYFADSNSAWTSRYARDEKLAKRLWEVSEELTADFL
ncbi:MAG: SDR family oxidoreductase [Pseudomonadales bacterium]